MKRGDKTSKNLPVVVVETIKEIVPPHPELLSRPKQGVSLCSRCMARPRHGLSSLCFPCWQAKLAGR